MNTTQTRAKKGGFTLLELLIVITILAILTLVVVLFINPVEMLKKSRDVQRMSDMSTLNAAIGLYLQASPNNTLGGATYCGTTGTVLPAGAGTKIRASMPSSSGTTSQFTTSLYDATSTADIARNDSNGWIPYINFSGVSSGAPIAKLPIDPVNQLGATASIDTLYYRFGCWQNNTFEIDATLESDAYKSRSTDYKAKTDGGNSEMRYEVVSDLRILPSSAPIL
mgnify:CR=1 FL=1